MGLCVPFSTWCDGYLDCPDGSDELPGCNGSKLFFYFVPPCCAFKRSEPVIDRPIFTNILCIVSNGPERFSLSEFLVCRVCHDDWRHTEFDTFHMVNIHTVPLCEFWHNFILMQNLNYNFSLAFQRCTNMIVIPGELQGSRDPSAPKWTKMHKFLPRNAMHVVQNALLLS